MPNFCNTLMSSLFFSSSRSPLSVALRRFILCRFSSIVTYATEEEEKSRFIHPSSVVHPNAILGEGVSIGPFCTIGPFAKLGKACQLYPGSHIFGNTELGDNCILMTGAVIGDDLPGQTVVGRNNVFGHHAVIGVKCQDMKYKFGNECFLEIGNNNEIREHVSIHRSSTPSDKTLMTANWATTTFWQTVHFLQVMLWWRTMLTLQEVLLFINFAVLVHMLSLAVVQCMLTEFEINICVPFLDLNLFVLKVSQDVPKYTIVSGERAELRGLNLEGLRRRGFSAMEIKSLRAAYRKIFMPTDTSSGNIEDRLSQVEQHKDLGLFPAVCSMVQSIRDSFAEHRRGICKFRSWSGS